MTVKTCKTCKKDKDILEYGLVSKGKTYRRNICKSCKNSYNKSYYGQNRKKIIGQVLENYYKKKTEKNN